MYEKYIASQRFLIHNKRQFLLNAKITWKTMLNNARCDIDKSAMEDKYLFLPEQIMAWGRDSGSDVEFIANREFRDFSKPEIACDTFSARHFSMAYLRSCMGFGKEFLKSFERFSAPYLDYIDDIARGSYAPVYFGIFICRKRA
jgi:hypothetical protein